MTQPDQILLHPETWTEISRVSLKAEVKSHHHLLEVKVVIVSIMP